MIPRLRRLPTAAPLFATFVTLLFVGFANGQQPVDQADDAELRSSRSPAMPPIDSVIEFDTPAADAVLAALPIFPADNPWNLPVDQWPLHPRSEQIVATIGPEKPLRYNPDMAFVIVPPDHPRQDLVSVQYRDESDAGPFPLPANLPIEGWPATYRRTPELAGLTLEDVQRDRRELGGDRHAIVVDPINRKLYEFFAMRLTDTGWQAAQASVFDLSSNRLRPDGWTSADAAGLPIFPAVVRYDELARGKIKHALRFTVRRSQRAYVYPATHYASRLTDPDLPRMGERFRLRADFDTAPFSREVRIILEALKEYGMIVADNGIEWAFSCAPDERIPVLHEELRRVKGADFEVVTYPPGYRRPK